MLVNEASSVNYPAVFCAANQGRKFGNAFLCIYFQRTFFASTGFRRGSHSVSSTSSNQAADLFFIHSRNDRFVDSRSALTEIICHESLEVVIQCFHAMHRQRVASAIFQRCLKRLHTGSHAVSHSGSCTCNVISCLCSIFCLLEWVGTASGCRVPLSNVSPSYGA